MTRPHGATWLGPVLGLAALTGCIAIATPSEAPPDAAPGAWRAAAAMPAARQELAVAEVGGRVYAMPPRGTAWAPRLSAIGSICPGAAAARVPGAPTSRRPSNPESASGASLAERGDPRA